MTKTFQAFFDEFPLSTDPVPSQNETDAAAPSKEERTQTRQDVSTITEHRPKVTILTVQVF